MRLLVTRPQEDAETIAGLLAVRGHDAIIAPLLEIRLHSGEPLELARHFVEFLLSREGQLLWAKKAGAPGGPLLCDWPSSLAANSKSSCIAGASR